jgi:E3 ubiquitin-protein ligase SHPRH
LLDARTDSSGLNLVNAQYVFLAEPLINTAIELQAIARVHRIGQQRPTTVYMYLIGGTVEEAIYDISVTRRLAHLQQRGYSNNTSIQIDTDANQAMQTRRASATFSGEAAIDAANSLELQQAPLTKLLVQKGKEGGGELVANADLWACLFGGGGGGKVAVSTQLEAEVDRHLREEAAEGRRRVANVVAVDADADGLRLG